MGGNPGLLEYGSPVRLSPLFRLESSVEDSEGRRFRNFSDKDCEIYWVRDRVVGSRNRRPRFHGV